MNYSSIVVVLLSVSFMHVHGMGENQPLVINGPNSRNSSVINSFAGYIPVFYGAKSQQGDIEKNGSSSSSSSNNNAASANTVTRQQCASAYPKEADIFDSKTRDTYAQFWATHGVPDDVKKWTKKEQINWVRARNCQECCCSQCAQHTYLCLCGMGCFAGVITLLVYAEEYTNGWDYDYSPETQSSSYTQSMSQTLLNLTLGSSGDSTHND